MHLLSGLHIQRDIQKVDPTVYNIQRVIYVVRDIKFRDLIFIYTNTKEKNKNVFAAVIKVSSADDLEVA